jgi:hypothetical protein
MEKIGGHCSKNQGVYRAISINLWVNFVSTGKTLGAF